MNANDLITQVHSEDDENGHDSHAQTNKAQLPPLSIWQRLFGCLLCRSRPPDSKHPTSVPLQQYNHSHHNNHAGGTGSNHSNHASSLNVGLANSNSVALNAHANSLTNKQLQVAASGQMSPPTQASHSQLNNVGGSSLVMNGAAPPGKYLLPPMSREDILVNKKTLVLDLDETLVHSSFKPIPNADFVLSIDLEGVIHRVYVRKRPGVDHFLRYCANKFEIVIFTASLAKYADPLLDILDRDQTVRVRLFREACVQHYGNYVKDLTHLGRKLENTIIVDNSPFSYMFQPENAIPITSWFNDKNDRQLFDLLPHLDHMAECQDIVQLLAQLKLQFVNGQVLLGS